MDKWAIFEIPIGMKATISVLFCFYWLRLTVITHEFPIT